MNLVLSICCLWSVCAVQQSRTTRGEIPVGVCGTDQQCCIHEDNGLTHEWATVENCRANIEH